MNFKIIPSKTFNKHLETQSAKSRKIIYDKIQLIKQNPYRFKKIHTNKKLKLFRIRLNLDKKETRLIYTIIEPNIILICLLERKKDYKDLEKYLEKIN